MRSFKNKHALEMARMYDKLATLEPGTDEHEKLLKAIVEARAGEHEQKELNYKLIMFGASLVATPLIELGCKLKLTKYIGKIEQMETFTSSAGRSISSWFKWK